jgi:tRNA (cytidine/uridine-2'-O-)-methyltransferase
MNIVLVEPEIPPNTGNVARLCAATKSALHLIEPFGFKLDDSQLKRAGMDYWQQVAWHRWKNWNAFVEKIPPNAKLWFVESNGPKLYSDVKYSADDYLIFGRETAGLPKQILENHREHWLRIPMFNAESRSLNLANCVALVLFEALRQQGFAGEIQ